MHIFFSIKDSKIKEKQPNISKFTADQLYDEIGLAHFKVTHYNKDILEFDNMLLGAVADLVLNYNSVKSGECSSGEMYKLDEDWGTNMKYTFKDGKFYLTFENGKNIMIPENDFLFFLRSFSTEAFNAYEKYYPSIIKNVHYCKAKTEVRASLGIL